MKPELDKKETTTCSLCGQQTSFIETRLCMPCWELQTRIERDPALACQVLQNIFIKGVKK